MEKWSNYPTTWTEVSFARYFLNTSIITVANLVGTIFSCLLAAYAFARMRFHLMAGSVMMLLPCLLVFFFAKRYFIEGVVMAGLKE